MKKEEIDRINYLYHKSKREGLTASEAAEQKRLRRAYIDDFKASLRAELDRIEIVDGPGPAGETATSAEETGSLEETVVVTEVRS